MMMRMMKRGLGEWDSDDEGEIHEKEKNKTLKLVLLGFAWPIGCPLA